MAYLIFILVAAVSFFVQNNFQRTFKKYSRLPLSRSMTGKDVAEKMLRDNGIYSHISLTELDAKQELRNQARKFAKK